MGNASETPLCESCNRAMTHVIFHDDSEGWTCFRCAPPSGWTVEPPK